MTHAFISLSFCCERHVVLVEHTVSVLRCKSQWSTYSLWPEWQRNSRLLHSSIMSPKVELHFTHERWMNCKKKKKKRYILWSLCGIESSYNKLLITFIKNKSRHNFTNNLSSATFFGFLSHLQTEYTIAVWTIHYNAVSGFEESSSHIIMEYY